MPCTRPTVDNGYIVAVFYARPPPDNDTFTVHDVLEFECDCGYTLFNSYLPSLDQSLCHPNGSWFPVLPRCIPEGILLCILFRSVYKIYLFGQVKNHYNYNAFEK